MVLLKVIKLKRNEKKSSLYLLRSCTFILSFCLSLCIFPSLCFAADDSPSGDSSGDLVYNDYYTDVHVSPVIQNLPEGDLVEVKSIKDTVTPSDSNGLKAILLSLIGDYDTVVTDYVYQNSSGYQTHSIQIERDYSWLASACIFALVIYCTFRGIYGLACRL